MTAPLNTAEAFGFTEALLTEVNASIAKLRWLNQDQTPVFGMPGCSEEQLERFMSYTNMTLPPDLRWLAMNTYDPGGHFFDWIIRPDRVSEAVDWVMQGIETDLENNSIWFDRWGERPPEAETRKEVFRADFETWPKIVPIWGHRFAQIEPCEPGQPVYSVMQSDIIYYGADLPRWLRKEFLPSPDWSGFDAEPVNSAWGRFGRNEGVVRGNADKQDELMAKALNNLANSFDKLKP